jgi:formylmethanofuran dehydrogenase subunit D
MMNKIEANLISGRTIMQGVAIEGHKHDEEYIKACGIVEMDVKDMKAIKIFPGQNVLVKSAYGEVIVRAVRATQGPHPGLVFIPMGPWANQITSTITESTGMPGFKGVKVTIEPAPNTVVMNGITLLQKTTILSEAKSQ